MMKLGAATVSRIIDIERFALPLDLLFPGVAIDDLRPHERLLAPHHVDFDTAEILLTVQSHLLQVGGLNILIDTCVGEHKERPRRIDWHRRQATGYLASLARAGLTPADIDIVLCTHLHADHVGWNTRLIDGRWAPTFPKARYMIGGTELAHWQAEEAKAPGAHNHGAWADSVLPVIEAGQSEAVDGGFELTRGLTVVPLAGHSPGQIGLCLCSQATPNIFFCGDAIHSPVQVMQPEISSRFCTDPAAAIATRMDLLEAAANDGALIVPGHLRGAEAMTVRRNADGYRPDFVQT